MLQRSSRIAELQKSIEAKKNELSVLEENQMPQAIE
jgi:hypothetical protein